MRRQISNVLTVLSLILGFCMLGAVIQGMPGLAIGLLLCALLLDGAAGQWARHRGRESELGAELDSLAALICFGVGVMVLAFEQGLRGLGVWGWIIAVGTAVAAALRLSRDNASRPDWPSYQGLPVPAFGVALGLLAGMGQAPRLLAGAALAMAVLMLSPLRYGRLAKSLWLQAALAALLLSAVFFPGMREVLLMLAIIYALGGAFLNFWGMIEGAGRARR